MLSKAYVCCKAPTIANVVQCLNTKNVTQYYSLCKQIQRHASTCSHQHYRRAILVSRDVLRDGGRGLAISQGQGQTLALFDTFHSKLFIFVSPINLDGCYSGRRDKNFTNAVNTNDIKALILSPLYVSLTLTVSALLRH